MIWYILASAQHGKTIEFRIIAGPLGKEEAIREADQRLKRTPESFKLTVVEFDPRFALA